MVGEKRGSIGSRSNFCPEGILSAPIWRWGGWRLMGDFRLGYEVYALFERFGQVLWEIYQPLFVPARTAGGSGDGLKREEE